MAPTFEVGDLVWAKLKGYSPWPGRVSIPAIGLKRPRNMSQLQCVYFFGTSNYGWVKGSDMKPYQVFKEKMMRFCNTSAFKAAVNQIDDYIENPECFPVIDGPIQNGTEENGVDDASDQSKENYPNNTFDTVTDKFRDFDFPVQDIKEEVVDPEDSNHEKAGKSPPTRERDKTSTVLPPIMDVVLRLRKVRVYKCEQCAMMYASSQQLDEHMKTHVHVFSAYIPLVRTEVQTYKCRTCGQDFQQQRECRLHELMHVQQDRGRKKYALNDNGIVKPFKCEECGARFALESTLDVHSVVHEPFPHLCHCGIGYFRATDFKAHRRTVHQNDTTWIPKIDYKGPKTKPEFVVKRPKRRLPSPESPEENIDSPGEGMESPEEREWSPVVFKTKLRIRPTLKAVLIKKEEPKPKTKTKRGRRKRPKRNMTEYKSNIKIKNEFGEEFDILRNESGRFACPAPGCEKDFPIRSHVVQHYKKHSSEKPFECEQCHKTFKRRGGYHTHLSIHGLGERRFICDYCDAGFYQKGRLLMHIIKHMGLKPYVCEICKKRFTQSAALWTHSKIHLGIKNFICQYCKKGFYNYSALKLHEHTHTGVKPYNCSYCEKDFSDPSALQRHIRTHTGDKVYPCKLCPMRFSDRSGYIAHNKRHTGVRTKQCEICFKKFYTNTDVQKHVLCVHTSIKKFECNECGKKFSLKSQLLLHLRLMHSSFVFSSNKGLEKHRSKGCHELHKKKKKVPKKINREPLEIQKDITVEMKIEE